MKERKKQNTKISHVNEVDVEIKSQGKWKKRKKKREPKKKKALKIMGATVSGLEAF
jgi:hypothetical protein